MAAEIHRRSWQCIQRLTKYQLSVTADEIRMGPHHGNIQRSQPADLSNHNSGVVHFGESKETVQSEVAVPSSPIPGAQKERSPNAAMNHKGVKHPGSPICLQLINTEAEKQLQP